MENLWPDGFNFKGSANPRDFVAAQLKELEKITKGKVYGELSVPKRARVGDTSPFVYDAIIASKYLENYRFRVFKMFYGIPYYPLEMDLDAKISTELGLYNYNVITEMQETILIENETVFHNILKKIFYSEHLGQIIGTLMSMIDDEMN